MSLLFFKIYPQAYALFGSIRFAIPLLVIIVGVLVGATFYESRVGSEVVQQQIYKSAWFGALMFLLAVNLAVSALSRYPWRGYRKVGFALTHLGLVVLIAGAAAVIHLNVEGMLLLHLDQGASHLVRLPGESFEMIGPDRTAHKADIWMRPDGTISPQTVGPLKLLNYADNAVSQVSFTESNAKLYGDGSGLGENPAVKLRLHSDRMGQTVEQWLAAFPLGYSTVNLGPAQLELVVARSSAEVEQLLSPRVSESVNPSVQDLVQNFMENLVQNPGQDPGQNRLSNSAKRLTDDRLGTLTISVDSVDSVGPAGQPAFDRRFDRRDDRPGQNRTIQLASIIARSTKQPIQLNQQLSLQIENFWPDFRLDSQNQPMSVSQELRNPTLKLRLSGDGHEETWFVFAIDGFAPIRSVLAGDPLDLHIRYQIPPAILQSQLAESFASHPEPSKATTDLSQDRSQNQFRIIVAPEGQLFYTSQSSAGFQRGPLEPYSPVSTGWVDFEVVLEEWVPHAQIQRQIVPVEAGVVGSPAVQVATPTGTIAWVLWGEPTSLEDESGEFFAAFSPNLLQLPFSVHLDDFVVERNEGSDSIAMWTSKIRIIDPQGGQVVERDVWMNHPTWYQGWKLAQASWNPGDLRQSTLQVKREPWWVTALTWSGSLVVVAGISVMFYGRSMAKLQTKLIKFRASNSEGLSNEKWINQSCDTPGVHATHRTRASRFTGSAFRWPPRA